MKYLMSKLLFPALIATTAGVATAGTVPASQAHTITYDFPYDALYFPAPAGAGMWIDKRVFQLETPTNYALTGKMNATLTATYDLGNGTGNANIALSFDVLVPRCDRCGMFDSDLVGTGHDGMLADNGSTLTYTTNTSLASGLYGRLLVYEIMTGQLPAFSGQIQFEAIRFDIEVVPLSAVPELPPAALLGLGLGVMGLVARNRRRPAHREQAIN